MRIDEQRDQLADYGAGLVQPFAMADKVVLAAGFVKLYPWTLGIAVLTATLVAKRNPLRWLTRGWAIWRAVRFAQKWLTESGFLNKTRLKS